MSKRPGGNAAWSASVLWRSGSWKTGVTRSLWPLAGAYCIRHRLPDHKEVKRIVCWKWPASTSNSEAFHGPGTACGSSNIESDITQVKMHQKIKAIRMRALIAWWLISAAPCATPSLDRKAMFFKARPGFFGEEIWRARLKQWRLSRPMAA